MVGKERRFTFLPWELLLSSATSMFLHCSTFSFPRYTIMQNTRSFICSRASNIRSRSPQFLVSVWSYLITSPIWVPLIWVVRIFKPDHQWTVSSWKLKMTPCAPCPVFRTGRERENFQQDAQCPVGVQRIYVCWMSGCRALYILMTFFLTITQQSIHSLCFTDEETETYFG